MAAIDLQRAIRPALVVVPAAGLAGGLADRVLGAGEQAEAIWFAATLPVLAVLIVEIVTSLRRGDLGLDVVAALSMSAALTFGETLAAVVVAIMYSGGQYLESFAERRARREMTALLARVPRTAVRHAAGGLEEVAIEEIVPGDRIVIRRGDVVAADGTVASGLAVLDQSALTGEPLPVHHGPGGLVMSGATNVGDAFELDVVREASESTYAGIVRLVEQAQRERAPMSRIADRYAMAFLAVTVALAGGAWLATGDPIRAVAVLVVATPCPLILAVPVAIVSGLSRAAAHGILIKGGGALETLARVRAVVLDKTGTLTEGQPRLVSVAALDDIEPGEALRLAASLDQASQHTIARTIVSEARREGHELSVPDRVMETAGEGVEGQVDGRHVVVGGTRFVAARIGVVPEVLRLAVRAPGALSVAVAVDGKPAAELVLADELRSGTAAMLDGLRTFGAQRIVLATGDRREVASAVAAGLRFDDVRSDLTPPDKVDVVKSMSADGPVMMVGDGVNDAPALAAADLGVAMGARGAAASAEAADIVLLVDRVDRLLAGMEIARGSRRIALQSVYVGLGLSFAGMIAAAFGYLAPVRGALLQEAIDVAVILNALRALRITPTVASSGGGAADRTEVPAAGSPRGRRES